MLRSVLRPILRPVVRSTTSKLGGGFTPISLFTASDKGYIYDNNDLSSFYLDSAGTTAATVNGLVGLQLDKSQNGVRRRNLLTYTEQFDNAAYVKVNTTITADAVLSPDGTTTADKFVETAINDYHYVNPTLSGIADNTVYVFSFYAKSAERTSCGANGRRKDGSFWAVEVNLSNGVVTLQSNIVSVSTSDAGNGWYRIAISINYLSGGSSPGAAIFITSTAQYLGDITKGIYVWGAQFELASTASAYQKIVAGAGGDWTPGNHRYQTTTGSKPILRGTPVGSNLVTNGDFASGTGWSVGSGWAIGSGVATGTAATGALSATLSTSVVAGNVYRITYTVATATAGSVVVNIGGVNGTSRTAAGTYTDYINTLNTGGFVIVPTTFSGSLDNIEVVDVSAGAVTAPYGLQYDGIDDFLTTASVDFTATDKMAVVMGVRKLSDAAQGIFLELSVNTGTNNGSFRMTFPGAGGVGSYGWLSKGTTFGAPTPSGFAAPITNVVSGIGDIANDIATIRVNGVATPDSTDQGTGTYGNYPFFFGRRAGTSLPYNGLDFGGICVNKTLTASQLSSAERWTAIRTGITF
jgi:hypothetical protein